MAKGGRRQGAGRKPSRPPGPPPVRPDVPMPDGLTPEVAAYWTRWAPHAHRMQTLLPETVPGFLLLCETAAQADELLAVLRAEGFSFRKVIAAGDGEDAEPLVTETKAHPLLSHWRALRLRVEQQMARYAIAPVGKVVDVPHEEDGGDQGEDFYGLRAVK